MEAQQRQLLKGSPSSTKEEVHKKTKALLEEYLSICDEKEAVSCVAEALAPSTVKLFVQGGVNMLLDKKDKDRSQIGTSFAKLMEKGYMLPTQLREGFKSTLFEADDLKCDVPKLFQF